MTAVRIPPHDLAAERAILGQAIEYPEHTDAILAAVKPEFMFRKWHQDIFKAISSIRAKGQHASMVGVRDWLIQSGMVSASDSKKLADLIEIGQLGSPFYAAREVEILQRTYPCINHDDLKQAVLDGLEGYEQLFREVLPNGKLPVR